MKEYAPSSVRNVALAGHSGAGKTTLAEAICFQLKLTDRMGRTEDGNTVCDYDAEEIRRGISINSSLIPFEYKQHKINMLDLPGYRDFVGEIRNCMRASDFVIIAIDATSGVEVGTELAWEYAEEFKLPRIFVINKINKERASFQKPLDQIRETFNCNPIVVSFPAGEGTSFGGCIDVLKMKMSAAGGRGDFVDIPGDEKGRADELLAALTESAAEGEDALTEKFLEGQSLTEEEVLRGLKGVMASGRACPVFTVNASDGTGIASILDYMIQCCPSPLEHCIFTAKSAKDNSEIPLTYNEKEPPVAFVFKTISDAFAGHLTFFKVLQGEVANDTALANPARNATERINHLMTLRGKKQEPVPKVLAGDIGVVAKLDNTQTNDTLCDQKNQVTIEPTRMPAHTIQMAVTAKSKEDEEKIGMAIHRLVEQDPTLQLQRDPVIRQTILRGMGDVHLDVAVARLKTQSKVEVELMIPRVPYRETITKKVEGQGKHKKQSGGRGQYGDCWIRLEPQPEGSGFVFDWGIVGGVIPTKFQPSVEKGLVQAMERGIIAGYTAVDIKATCYDGSYHTVDSSDMAFQVAASKAFKIVSKLGNPVIMEPIYKVRVVVPEQYMGDVMGDLNSRRGRILGMNSEGRKQVIEAHVPLSEMFEYSKQLRSITQGRGTFEMVYDHYERTPGEEQAKIVAASKPEEEEEE